MPERPRTSAEMRAMLEREANRLREQSTALDRDRYLARMVAMPTPPVAGANAWRSWGMSWVEVPDPTITQALAGVAFFGVDRSANPTTVEHANMPADQPSNMLTFVGSSHYGQPTIEVYGWRHGQRVGVINFYLTIRHESGVMVPYWEDGIYGQRIPWDNAEALYNEAIRQARNMYEECVRCGRNIRSILVAAADDQCPLWQCRQCCATRCGRCQNPNCQRPNQGFHQSGYGEPSVLCNNNRPRCVDCCGCTPCPNCGNAHMQPHCNTCGRCRYNGCCMCFVCRAACGREGLTRRDQCHCGSGRCYLCCPCPMRCQPGDPFPPESDHDIKRLVGVEWEFNGAPRTGPLKDWIKEWRGGWHRDGSCGEEIVTAPLGGSHVEKSLVALGQAFKDAGARADAHCSVHVHIDAADLNFERLFRLLDVYCRTEPILYAIGGQHRTRNGFASPVGRRFAEALNMPARYREDSIMGVAWDMSLEEAHDYFHHNAPHKKSGGRYKGLNLCPWLSAKAPASPPRDDCTVEFRIHENTLSSDRVVGWVKMLAGIVEYAAHAKDSDLKALPKSPLKALGQDIVPASKGYLKKQLQGWRKEPRKLIHSARGNWKILTVREASDIERRRLEREARRLGQPPPRTIPSPDSWFNAPYDPPDDDYVDEDD